MLAYDRSLRSYDGDGHLHVERCNISKANVRPYYGRTIPNAAALGLAPDRIYNMYCDPEELRKAADTFAGKPLLLHHIGITADAPATELVVGTVGSTVTFDAPYLTAPISVWTREAITAIESHRQEQLSPGYRYTADMTAGISPEGVAYDGRMCHIMGNHVALVEEGRTGPDVVVADSQIRTFSKMKYPQILAAIAAALGLQPAQVIVLDEALEAAGVEAEEAPKKKKKKSEELACDDGGAPKPTMDQAEIDAAVKAAGDAATATVHALYAAREAVAAKVGVVTLDSAESVYRYAMDQQKIEHTAVTAAGLAALWDAAQKAAPAAPLVTQDSAPEKSITDFFPGLSFIRKG